jgi:teichuronic acid biosynthesis glycosyltransferase TuaG
MMSRANISVIMPAYNAEKFISQSIESVLNQTFVEWELIIVDDGSTDKTSEIVKKYARTDKRIKLFYQENGKQGKARNLAISKSDGKYLAFLDADDIMLPNHLDIQLKRIDFLKADLVFSNCYIFTKLPLNGDEKSYSVEDKCYESTEGINSFLEWNRIPILTVLVKKECVLKVGGFSEVSGIQNAEDYHLWLKLLLNNGKLCGTNKVHCAYRLHTVSASNDDRLSEFEVLYALKELLNNSKVLPPSFKKNFLNRKRKYIRTLKEKDQGSFIEFSYKYFQILSCNRLHFKILNLIETYCGRKYSFYYLNLLTSL